MSVGTFACVAMWHVCISCLRIHAQVQLYTHARMHTHTHAHSRSHTHTHKHTHTVSLTLSLSLSLSLTHTHTHTQPKSVGGKKPKPLHPPPPVLVKTLAEALAAQPVDKSAQIFVKPIRVSSAIEDWRESWKGEVWVGGWVAVPRFWILNFIDIVR